MSSDLLVEDNFLAESEFKTLQELLLGSDFPWYYNKGIVFDGDNDFQFTHSFYLDLVWKSSYYPVLDPILRKVNPFALFRIKANLLPLSLDITENTFHTDIGPPFLNLDRTEQWSTSIMYINTNNGYTMFEDGRKVESVENRFITFPANWKHKGTTCTDENIRVVINFNWFLNE